MSENKEEKTRFDNAENAFFVLMIVQIGIYIIFSCLSASLAPGVDDGTTGLFVILGIPIGLGMCEILPIIGYILGEVKDQRIQRFVPIIKIVFDILALCAIFIFYSGFLSGVISKGLSFYINIIVIVEHIIMVSINMALKSKEKKLLT